MWKDLKKIPKNDFKRIITRIAKLDDDPRPIGSEKSTGEELYRVRQCNYRIVYSIKENELTVWVIKVGHRKDVYRKSEHEAAQGSLGNSAGESWRYVEKEFDL